MTVKVFCLLLISLLFGLFNACGSQDAGTATIASSSDKGLSPIPRVDVFYFTRGQPCHCIAEVAEIIQDAVLAEFNGELTSGKLTFQIVDLHDATKGDIIRKCNAHTYSLFICEVNGDSERIYEVREIWSTPRDAIGDLVTGKIEKSLNGYD